MDQLMATSEPGLLTVQHLFNVHGVEKQAHEDKGCRTCPIQFCSVRARGQCPGDCKARRDYMNERDGE